MLQVALRAADRATETHRAVAAAGFSVATKKAEHDRVTDADYRAEAAIIDVIREEYPDHNVVAEEGTYEVTSSPYRWIIDPLDGTLNFSRGIPFYSVSIGLMHEDSLLLGVVKDSFRNETFSALRGHGAFLNGARIRTSEIDRYEHSIVISGFFYEDRARTEENLKTIGRFFGSGVMSVRQFGSAALDMCYVACGRADGFWERALHLWDFAAAALIVREAGGTVTDFHGSVSVPDLQAAPQNATSIVASNGPFHPNMLETITVSER